MNEQQYDTLLMTIDYVRFLHNDIAYIEEGIGKDYETAVNSFDMVTGMDIRKQLKDAWNRAVLSDEGDYTENAVIRPSAYGGKGCKMTFNGFKDGELVCCADFGFGVGDGTGCSMNFDDWMHGVHFMYSNRAIDAE